MKTIVIGLVFIFVVLALTAIVAYDRAHTKK